MSYPQQMPPQQMHPQQMHPQQGQHVHNPEWQSGFCSCTPFSTCLLGSCCPCILVGKTSARIMDPSLQSYSCLNQDCMLAALTNCVGFGWIYICIKRGEIRQRFGLEGSSFGDCCRAFCCHCCAVIQQDNEVKRRLEAGPVMQGYAQQAPMKM